MVLHIEQGKRHKDRLAMLSPVMLTYLQDWWYYAQAQHLMLHGGWLFPGQQAIDPLSTRQLSRACAEAGIDIRVIQILLGHSKLETTALYTQVATKLLHEVISPLDALKLPH
jgi:integrase/recombinase XerD